MRLGMKACARIAGAIGVFALAASAWAQDYTVTTANGQLITRPSGATVLAMSSAGGQTTPVALPFEFPYFGRIYTSVLVSPCGMVVPGAASINGVNQPGGIHGENASTLGFPYTPSGIGGTTSGGYCDGVIAPYWDTFYLGGTSSTGQVFYWTDGSSPNRRFVVSWDGASYASGPQFIVQLQLCEASGRIVFAYSSTASAFTYGNLADYICGIDGPDDARYVAPLQSGRNNHGYPGGFFLDPRPVTYVGTLQYDKFVADASGVGNSVLANRPLGAMRLELRNAGVLSAYATTGADGAFSITGLGVPATSTGTLSLMAQGAACRVLGTTAGAPTEWTVASNVNLGTSASLGVIDLGAAGDAGGTIRAALNVARACQAAYDWAAPRTTDSIQRIDVLLDQTLANTTNYAAAAGANAAAMTVAGAAAANPDAWDDAVVTKTYGRHVLASIAAAPTTSPDYRFDARTDSQNAFAEGFGWWLWAVVSGSSQGVDSTNGTTATVHDLESPTLAAPPGPDVAGRVAAALVDLLDPANETIDSVDGSSDPGRVFRIADAFSVAPTMATFEQAWIDAGYDSTGLARVLIGDGVTPDDASEPNDSAGEAAAFGPLGVKRSGFVLNRFNEDWFAVNVPSAVPALVADATFDRVAVAAVVQVEIRDAAGSLLASGAPVGTSGPFRATTSPLTAGTYKVGVRFTSGATVPEYSLQTYRPLDMNASPLRDWTVGRDFDVALGVVGGIAPYALTTPTSVLPPGLFLRASDQHAIGTPTTSGVYEVTVRATDDGNPANIVQRTQTVVIHDVFKLPIAPFVGFPVGKAIDVTLPTHEGTPPFTLTMTSGALTSGLTFAPNSLHVTGTANAGPSSAFELDGVDVAGSADHVATRAVVAVAMNGKKTPADLAAGTDACGWWFDAVEGSTVTFSVATAKGQPKRALTGALIAPDRNLVTMGKIVGRTGSIAGSRLICPVSGRCYFIASSADAGAATQLAGTLTVTPPRAGKGSFKSFAPTATTTIEVGALAGATLKLTFAGDKKATLVAKIVAVLDPSGVAQPFVPSVKPTATGGVLTMQLATGGTWTVVLGATTTSNANGKLTYSYSLKQPKGATYSAK